MARFAFIASALFALRALAQTSSPYLDEKTGINFTGYQHTSGYTFGIALPENPTTDFIAQIKAPITNGGGWAGFSMGQSMTGNLLVVAWPNEDKIVSSFRLATGYTNPAVKTGDFSMAPIPDGTYVNETAFSYTFLCKNCISDDVSKGLVIYESPNMNIMGWAFSDTALTDSTSASATLNYHSAGFGAFGLPMDNAKKADFATWATLAVEGGAGSGNSTTPGNGGNSTTPITGGNNTAIIGNSTYDYIVAGGGAAGIVAAQRLAESGSSVLLIERGGPSLAFTGNTKTLPWNDTVSMYDVPGYGYYLSDVGSPAFCTDTADQAGCLLGGGTSVNAMMFVKPQERDFDDKWPVGWKWADVSAAADRVWERNPGQTYGSEDGQRYDDAAYDVLSQFFAGQGWAETDFIKDPNAKVNVYGRPPWNVENGLRSGVVRTYLPLAQKLSNFELMLNTNVIRAVRDGSAITGVEVQNADGQRVIYNVKAGGSVLLAAGALSTPRILFNSGIGPAEQIRTVAAGTSGVTLPTEEQWIDLPVGAEVKDHPIFTIKFATTSNITATPKSAFVDPDQTTIDLFAKGSGILAQSGQRLNWWSSVNTTGGEVFFQGTCNAPSDNTIQMKVYITHGLKSVGSVEITGDGATTFGTNPHMTDPLDTEAITLMMNRLISMTQGSNSTLSIIAPTGVSNVTAADLSKEFKTGSHYVGTAKMGIKGESGVVVDTDTKVYGTDNLFVVDASIHPDLPTGNTQAIVMVAAEAAVDRILTVGSGAGSSLSPVATGASGTIALPASTSVGSGPVGTDTSSTPSSTPIDVSAPVEPAPTVPTEVPAASPFQSTSAAAPTPSAPASAEDVPVYGRCGGIGYEGSTQCAGGSTCKKQNDWYSQCLPAGSSRREASAQTTRRSSKIERRTVKTNVGKLPVGPDTVRGELVVSKVSYLDTYDF